MRHLPPGRQYLLAKYLQLLLVLRILPAMLADDHNLGQSFVHLVIVSGLTAEI